MSDINEAKLKELAKDYIKRCGLDVCRPDMNRSAELAYQSGYMDAQAALQSELDAVRAELKHKSEVAQVWFEKHLKTEAELSAEREAASKLVEVLNIYAAIGDDENSYLDEKLEEAMRLRPEDKTTINLGGKLVAADAIKALSEYKKDRGENG